MTREQFKNLKIGDLIIYQQNYLYPYNEKVLLKIIKIKEKKLIFGEIKDVNQKNNYGFENFAIFITQAHLVETIGKKPKKLYKPWG